MKTGYDDNEESEYIYEVLEESLGDEQYLDADEDKHTHSKAAEKNPKGGIQEVLCTMCLSRCRRMILLQNDEISMLHILLDQIFDRDTVVFLSLTEVCWECRQQVINMLRFQAKVLQANAILQQKDPEEITTLSNLNAVTLKEIDFEFEHESPRVLDTNVQITEPMKRKRGRPRKYPIGEVVPEPDETKVQWDVPEENTAPKVMVKKRGRPRKSVDDDKMSKYTRIYLNHKEMLEHRQHLLEDMSYLMEPFRCENCIKTFTLEMQLEKHIITTHDERAGPYECDICGTRFTQPDVLKRHRKLHFKLFACGQCGSTKNTLSAIDKHYRELHGDDCVYQCTKCRQVFTTERKMRYHKELMHKPPVECDICKRAFRNRQVYKNHMIWHKGVEMIKCPKCTKPVRGESGLYHHMRKEHNPHLEKATCHECDVVFKSKRGLAYHLKTSVKHAHPSQLVFQCEMCTKRFLSETALNQHKNYYHLEYKCNICQKLLNSRYTHSKHMVYVHGGRKPTRNTTCERCGNTFASRYQMKMHERVHTGERPYECTHCEMKFSQKSSLKTHTRVLHGVRDSEFICLGSSQDIL